MPCRDVGRTPVPPRGSVSCTRDAAEDPHNDRLKPRLPRRLHMRPSPSCPSARRIGPSIGKHRKYQARGDARPCSAKPVCRVFAPTGSSSSRLPCSFTPADSHHATSGVPLPIMGGHPASCAHVYAHMVFGAFAGIKTTSAPTSRPAHTHMLPTRCRGVGCTSRQGSGSRGREAEGYDTARGASIHHPARRIQQPAGPTACVRPSLTGRIASTQIDCLIECRIAALMLPASRCTPPAQSCAFAPRIAPARAHDVGRTTDDVRVNGLITPCIPCRHR
ncbi:hypothetical protein DFH06DRAFT_573375 [Mycena polygramma]|nr:hypothetical protein DFH06DRAFT_573375 [Mycena polygramma]